jgi:lipopolysaccharide export system protein LptA
MRWQRAARLLVALVGFGTAAALYVFSRDRPVREPAATTVAKDPQALVQSGAGVDVQYVNDTERYRLKYGTMKTFEGGHLVWEQVHVLFKEDGTEVWADHAEIRGRSRSGDAPAKLELKGNVRLKTGEGASVAGQSATYDDATGVTDLPGPVTFTRGRISGSGTGAIYERDAGVFRLLADGHLTTAADAKGAALDATGKTVTFNRATRALLLDGQARVAHGTDVMTADRATLFLSEDEQQFQVIELRANARVVPAPGGASTTPDMQAQDIDLGFYPGTQTLQRAVLQRQARIVLADERGRRSIEGGFINLTTAPDGSTLTSLDANERVVVRTPGAEGAPARQISAASLVSRGDDQQGLTGAVFEGGARFEETPAAPRGGGAPKPRTGTAARLTLKLQGKLDAIDEALFEGNAHFVDGVVDGSADVGTYYASAGKLRLQPARAPKLHPHVKDEHLTVDATEQIEIDLNTHSLSARGTRDTVKTVSTGKPSAKTQPSLFSASETMYGFAAAFDYDSAAKRAIYTGAPGQPARLKQGETEVFGVRIELHDETRDLEAKGDVRSIFTLKPAESGANKTPPGLYTITAAHMLYREAERTATYTGDIVTLANPDGKTTAKKMVVTLLPEGRSLDRLEATTDVQAVLSGSREALADFLLFEAATGRYTLRGRPTHPLLVKARDQNGGCSRTSALVGYFLEGEAHFPGPPVNPGGSQTASISCSEALKR